MQVRQTISIWFKKQQTSFQKSKLYKLLKNDKIPDYNFKVLVLNKLTKKVTVRYFVTITEAMAFVDPKYQYDEDNIYLLFTITDFKEQSYLTLNILTSSLKK